MAGRSRTNRRTLARDCAKFAKVPVTPLTRAALVALAVLVTDGAGAQELYKWVDADGHVHYSDTAPKGADKARAIELAPAAPGVNPKPDAGSQWQQEDNAFRARQAAREAEEKSAEKKKEDEARRQRACLDAQQKEQRLASGRRVYNTDDQGNRIYLDDSQRQVEIDRARAREASNC